MLTNFLKNNKKRSRETSSPITSSLSSLNEITSLQGCFHFLSPNEYSDKTLGLSAFLLRKSVGDINFSDIIDEAEKHDILDKAEKHDQLKSATDIIALLENRRENLKSIDASIEKNLMLNRLISYIDKNKIDFMTNVSEIRTDMKIKIKDDQVNQTMQYPYDLQKREYDILNRKRAQNIRRLFCYRDIELQEPKNIIYLKNRTTEHLTYLISRMKIDLKFRDIGINEIHKILDSSFIIIDQPHSDINPVLIYERQAPGMYKAKVSVTIISLLNDFMQTYPNIIQLHNIKPTLSPSSSHYKILEPESISWNLCQLNACSDSKPQIIQYAELSFILIEQTNKNNGHVYFAQALHSLKFTYQLQINLPDYDYIKTHYIILESLQFAIGNHTNQIPHLLTRVILNEIRILANPKPNDIDTILFYILRYFIHRTGVKPTKDLENYLRKELNKAHKARKNFQTLEDIYMDFLVPFVYQVEFMGKHPILAMFYAEELFLGPCNKAKATETLENSKDINSVKIGLRFNFIEVDYKSITNKPVLGRVIKHNPCAVRVDIYKSLSSTEIEYCTFNPDMLINDISKFVFSSTSPNAKHLRILSNLNDRVYKCYSEFKNYYHPRLNEISQTNEKYKYITEIIDNIKTEDDEEISSDESSILESQSMNSISSSISNNDQHINATTVSNYKPIPYDDQNNNQTSSSNVVTVTRQQLIQCILSDSELLTELMYHMNRLNLINSSPQPQCFYQHQQPSPVIMVPQLQQQQETSNINFYQTNTTNESQACSIHDTSNVSEQYSTEIDVWKLLEHNFTQELISTDQVSSILTDEDIPLSLDDSIQHILSSQNQ